MYVVINHENLSVKKNKINKLNTAFFLNWDLPRDQIQLALPALLALLSHLPHFYYLRVPAPTCAHTHTLLKGSPERHVWLVARLRLWQTEHNRPQLAASPTPTAHSAARHAPSVTFLKRPRAHQCLAHSFVYSTLPRHEASACHHARWKITARKVRYFQNCAPQQLSMFK